MSPRISELRDLVNDITILVDRAAKVGLDTPVLLLKMVRLDITSTIDDMIAEGAGACVERPRSKAKDIG